MESSLSSIPYTEVTEGISSKALAGEKLTLCVAGVAGRTNRTRLTSLKPLQRNIAAMLVEKILHTYHQKNSRIQTSDKVKGMPHKKRIVHLIISLSKLQFGMLLAQVSAVPANAHSSLFSPMKIPTLHKTFVTTTFLVKDHSQKQNSYKIIA